MATYLNGNKADNEYTAKERFMLTLRPDTQRMKDAKGSELEIAAWMLYSDVNADGKEQEILSILTTEQETYATNSATFKRDFLNMWDAFSQSGETLEKVAVIGGTSKSGREFITCTIA